MPPSGQRWTSLREMTSGKDHYKNIFTPDEVDDRVISIATEPKYGIGQRAILLKTDHGNVLWDMIAFLDEETIQRVCYRPSHSTSCFRSCRSSCLLHPVVGLAVS